MITFEVTQDDIDIGSNHLMDGSCCVLHRAIQRAVPGADVLIYGSFCTIDDTTVRFNETLCRWHGRLLDRREFVGPRSFQLDYQPGS